MVAWDQIPFYGKVFGVEARLGMNMDIVTLLTPLMFTVIISWRSERYMSVKYMC
jgi:hypothetical protein